MGMHVTSQTFIDPEALLQEIEQSADMLTHGLVCEYFWGGTTPHVDMSATTPVASPTARQHPYCARERSQEPHQ
jgi:hypothetical protein